MSGAADPIAESRRHCLARLAEEARTRGLRCTPAGHNDALLHVSRPSNGNSTMVFAMPSASGGWSYLWSGGGSAGADDPAQAADLLAIALGH
jgi:hypothetical protein